MKQTLSLMFPCFTSLRMWKASALLSGVCAFLLLLVACGGDDGDDGEGGTPTPVPGPGTDEVVFKLDFGADPGKYKFIDEFTSWQTQTGSGTGNVSYEGFGVKIRGGYDGASVGASGQGYATMTATKQSNYFMIRDISLPSDEKNYTLTFYAAFATGDVTLTVSNGSFSRTLDYQASPTYNNWKKVTVGFTLANPVSTLTINLAPSQAFDYNDRNFGLNFDDIVLTTGGGGQTIDLGTVTDPDPGSKEYRYPELPANWAASTSEKATISGDYAFFTHWTHSVRTNKEVRNYTYCYDTRRHNPIWVAYPMHAVYGEGGFGRTKPEPWAPDPALDAKYQSKIYKSDGPTGSDPYQFWSTNTIYKQERRGSWIRGHLCMSSERGGADTEINRQTFYPTNIAPQPNGTASTFGSVWGSIESLISGTENLKNDITADDNSSNLNIVADTLFVVAGCHYEHDDWTDYDSSNYTQPEPDPNQKLCVMPTHQYKVLLRTRDGNSKKKIQDCSASELQTIGFWVDTFTDLDATSAKAVLNQIAVPVSTIEKKTGLIFFPGVPDKVKEQCNPSDWGF